MYVDVSVWFFIALTCDLLSIAGCLWLSWRLRRMNEFVKLRLFPRQVRALAMADLVFHLAVLPSIVIGGEPFAPFENQNVPAGKEVCMFSRLVLSVTRITAVLHEMHIALSFLAQSFRWARALSFINRALSFVWAVSIPIGIVEGLTPPRYNRPENGTCGTDELGVGDVIFFSTMLPCAVISLISYMVVTIRSHWFMPRGSALRSNFRRAAMYPFNTLFTYGLILVVYSDRRYFDNHTLFAAASTMEFCSGLLNTLSYALQSRYASALLQRRGCGAQIRASPSTRSLERFECSFHVSIGGVDIIDIVDVRCEEDLWEADWMHMSRRFAEVSTRLENNDAKVRNDAVHALSELVERGDERAIRSVCARLDHENAEVRSAAVRALAEVVHKGDWRAILSAMPFLEDDDCVRNATMQFFDEIAIRGDKRTIDEVAQYLHYEDARLRSAAVQALSKVVKKGDVSAMKAISKCLQDQDACVRYRAVQALCDVSEKGDERMITIFTACLHDNDAAVRSVATWAVQVLGTPDPPCLSPTWEK